MELGLIKERKTNKACLYSLEETKINDFLQENKDLLEAIKFFSEIAPLSVVGSYILDKFDSEEEKINKLNELLSDVPSLFDKSIFHYFDQTTSSDEFLSEEYINKFKTIKKAIEEKKNIVLDYTNIRNENYVEESVPLKQEYSLKNNKFRLLAVRFRNGKKELKAYNVKQINN